MRLFLFILFTVSAAAQSVGDFSISYKATPTGPQTIKSWAKANSTLWGTDGSGNPQSITIGSGLSLASGVLTASGGGVGTGTVTSVGLSLPNIFSVTGSPVTASGTLAGSLATQSANTVFAGPTTGTAAAPTFRVLGTADIPDLSSVYQPLSSVLTGISGVVGSNGLLSKSGSLYEWLGISTGGITLTDAGKIVQFGVGGTLSMGQTLYFSTPADGGGYWTSSLSVPAGVSYGWVLPAGSGTLARSSDISVANLAGLGTGVATALAINIGSAGAPVLFNGAAGTPQSITLTNADGTAASLVSGYATAARGLQTSSTTVAVSPATAPSTGQVLTATSATAATWQTPSGSTAPSQATKTDTETLAASTWTDVTGLSIAFTAGSTSQKIMLCATIFAGTATTANAQFRFVNEDGTVLQGDTAGSRIPSFGYAYTGVAGAMVACPMMVVFTPGTTSARTYKVQWYRNGTGNIHINRGTADTDSTSFFRTASTFILQPY